MRAHAFIWGALLLLTLTSFLTGHSLPAQGAATVILALAGLKCAALGWQFMELRTAHWAWRTALFALLAAILAAVGGLAA